MKKSFRILLNLLFVTLWFVSGISCSNKKTEDKFSIQDYSEEEIVKGSSYSKLNSFTKTVNQKTTVKSKKFSGFEKIMTFNPAGDSITVNVSGTVESGELRIVICDSEKIYYEFEVNGTEQSYSLPLDNKKYYLKAIGKNAAYKIDISYEKEKSALPVYERTIL